MACLLKQCYATTLLRKFHISRMSAYNLRTLKLSSPKKPPNPTIICMVSLSPANHLCIKKKSKTSTKKKTKKQQPQNRIHKLYLNAKKKRSIVLIPNFLTSSVDVPFFSWYFTCETAHLFQPRLIWKWFSFRVAEFPSIRLPHVSVSELDEAALRIPQPWQCCHLMHQDKEYKHPHHSATLR